MCDFSSHTVLYRSLQSCLEVFLHLPANLLTLLNRAASKHRGRKHFSLIRRLESTSKSVKAGIGYVQRGEAAISSIPWQAHAVLLIDLCTVSCDVMQSDEPREKSREMGLIAYVKMHRFFLKYSARKRSSWQEGYGNPSLTGLVFTLGQAELEMQRCRMSLPETSNLPEHGGEEATQPVNWNK